MTDEDNHKTHNLLPFEHLTTLLSRRQNAKTPSAKSRLKSHVKSKMVQLGTTLSKFTQENEDYG